MEKIVVRGAFNYDSDAVSNQTGLKCDDISLAKQEFLEESDINVLVDRFGLLGEPPTGVHAPVYGDFSHVKDFTSAMQAIALANESFDSMPAHVRARFQNNPAYFVDFCSDDKNYDEAVALGLVFKSTSEANAPDLSGVKAADVPNDAN